MQFENLIQNSEKDAHVGATWRAGLRSIEDGWVPCGMRRRGYRYRLCERLALGVVFCKASSNVSIAGMPEALLLAFPDSRSWPYAALVVARMAVSQASSCSRPHSLRCARGTCGWPCEFSIVHACLAVRAIHAPGCHGTSRIRLAALVPRRVRRGRFACLLRSYLRPQRPPRLALLECSARAATRYQHQNRS